MIVGRAAEPKFLELVREIAEVGRDAVLTRRDAIMTRRDVRCA